VAYIWSLIVAFDEAGAPNAEMRSRTFAETFNTSPIQFGTRVVQLDLDRSSHGRGDPRWECAITPQLVKADGAREPIDGASDKSPTFDGFLARALYDRLCVRPEYDWAWLMCGATAQWRSVPELVEDLSPGGSLRRSDVVLDGLCIHARLYQRAQRPPGFERFATPMHSDDAFFMWRPWKSPRR
jgi:hypothetical protein